MAEIKHIVLFGAGKSATVLIDYLKKLATGNIWKVTVADSNLAVVEAKVGKHELVKAAQVNIENETQRRALVTEADIVISMMPPNLHYLLALDCIDLGKHLLTASYVSESINALHEQIAAKGLLFLCEMGLDPGIDHMSAMQLFHRIQQQGGKITSFKSHCGGLVAPESDDNPWHYKISWNPRNVVLAGKAGADYKVNGREVHLPYTGLFDTDNIIEIPGHGIFAYYANRDSLAYEKLYGLQGIQTLMRTTLRHPEFSFGWKNIVDLKLTDEEKVYETDGLSVAGFFKTHFERNGFGEWLNNMLTSRLDYAKTMMEKLMQLMDAEEQAIEAGEPAEEEIMMIDEKGALTSLDLEEIKDKATESVAGKMHEANLSMKQLFFLGLDDEETLINKGLCSAADVLQFILESKWALKPEDKDMIVMMHEIDYELNDKMHAIKSSLVLKGEDSIHTAMAKTVGLPLGIAAKLILEGRIKEKGLHIPVSPEIYEPVLQELQQHGIVFNETEH
ncbi:saccharopine dehydrogenase NADP-binding domain-containing protein [Panacibacter sp. DH6]|uniref:Saccharopine dehydrogenase NADP-binding domain-containing protein n=1 Tax=Panacibacter microcysteis TaxID=2793269 RepID=A0A931ME02_9BACT|nr:saccharopine dehydrogenase C-terminal domain-containing protein [Panacibacter microcysteis]MBG9378009.1 saccharopine dehydrogenase NADP-binding domain-containing protein [Panacibacter microcysteis]